MTDSSNKTNAGPVNGQIFLTGFRGSGKTSVAAIVGSRIGLPTVDLDAEIVLAAGKTIADIFRDSGEDCFRDWETKLLKTAADGPQAIISLGGGAVLRPENRQLIRSSGVCIWLDADPVVIAKRLAGDEATESQRPGLTSLPVELEIRDLMQARRPIYDEISELRVDTDRLTIDQVAEQIADWLTLPNKG
jgi:shikimate kinase